MNAPASRRRFLSLAAAAAALLRSRPARAQSVTVRVGASTTEAFGEPYYLADAGIASKAGIDVQLLPFSSGGQMINAMMGGSLDLGLSDMLQVANASAHDLPIAFFAGSVLYRTEAPLTLLCVAKNSPVQTAKDLEGQVIGVNGLKTMAEISSRELLKSQGADMSKLSFVEIPPLLAVPALLRGTVAAAVVGEPLISAAGDSIRHFAKPYDAVAKSFYICSWMARRDWLAQNAALVRRLVPAIYETARWANAHHDETAPILGKYLKVDPAAVRSTTRATFATALDPKEMQPVLDIGARYGLLEKPVAASELIAAPA
jgi:ABC-type nitrate/sulfonate/bicarbonate transport system substrate-binding protein